MPQPGACSITALDKRSMLLFMAIVRTIICPLTGWVGKVNTNFQPAFFYQGRLHFGSHRIFGTMPIRDHFNRLTLYSEFAFNFSGPGVQRLVNMLNIVNRYRRTIFFQYLKTQVTQLQPMRILPKPIGGLFTTTALRTPLYQISDIA